MAGGSEERPAPSAIGTLETRPFVHLLVYARNRRLTGTLEVHAPDGRSGTIQLWRGRVWDARTAPAVTYFGALAYELGAIDTVTLDSTLLEISKSKRLHGEVLVERGALTAEQRDSILTEQTCRKIHHLFSLPPESTFSFYDGKPTAEEPSFTLDPIMPAWRGMRDHPPTDNLNEVLARFATASLRLSNEGPIARAGFDVDEMALCEALTWKAMTLAQIRAVARIPAARVELLVYLLIITKCIEPEAASSPALPVAAVRSPSSGSLPAVTPSEPRIPVAPGSSPSMPAMPRTVLRPSGTAIPAADSGEMRRASLSFKVPSAPAFRSAGSTSSPKIAAAAIAALGPADLGAVGLAHRASVVQSESPFETLGLPDGAPLEAARAAYFRLSKTWHPDRLPDDLKPFRSEVEKIFNQMARAHRALTDPDERRDLLGTGETPAAIGALPVDRPRKDVIREIDQALGKREFEIAEALARSLSDADADDAEAHALVAWAMASGGEATEELLRKALPLLDNAVHREADCERALFYRGVLNKRLGSSVAAYRDFNRVVQVNPKHVDAQRELRIFEMRARKGSGEHALGQLISKAKKK